MSTASPTTRRHRVKPATPAAATSPRGSVPAVGNPAPAGVAALPMLRFVMPNGVLELQDTATTVRLLEQHQAAKLAAEAEQAALAVVYRVGGQPDEARPYGGLLTRRLDISQRSAEQLLRDGRLRYTCTGGSRGYRVSERAVREYLGDLPPPA